jgi:hypothetical protein
MPYKLVSWVLFSKFETLKKMTQTLNKLRIEFKLLKVTKDIT